MDYEQQNHDRAIRKFGIDGLQEPKVLFFVNPALAVSTRIFVFLFMFTVLYTLTFKESEIYTKGFNNNLIENTYVAD